MPIFNFRLSHKSTPVVATDLSLDSWCHKQHTQYTRFVQKVEICTALCAGRDGWGMQLSKDHYHTLLRVSLVPTHSGPGAVEDTLFIERVLSTGGAHHSVTPISDTLTTGGTLLHPDVHDRICVVGEGPSTSLVHDLEVERTLTFSDRALTLVQLAQILRLVSQTTRLICDGGDCKFQSRSFTFTCLAALAPTFPPRRAAGRAASKVSCGLQLADMIDDSVFEMSAEAFLCQVPWLIRDAESLGALKLMAVLKDDSPGRSGMPLYH